MIDLGPPQPGTIVLPDTSPSRSLAAPAKSTDLAKHQLKGGAAPANARRARVATDALLRDPNFDPSLTASRARLEKALAIGSAIALRQAENGMVDDGAVALLKDMAATYRTLVQTEAGDPLAQRPGESDEDYRARLESMRG